MAVKGSYTRRERELAKAATLRYGASGAARVLSGLWGVKPSVEVLARWVDSPRVASTEVASDYWRAHDESVAYSARERLSTTYEKAVAALEVQLDEPDDMQRMSKVQGLTIAVGIIYDKIAPSAPKGGLSVDGIGNNVTINVIAPPPIAPDGQPSVRRVVLEQVA